ncbi:unnamed protein product [Arabis nemorensis]|uniref:Uncharacterized protein n=1 Tax=Arabis nemorensis TaxID=586526 RepID=A0A565BZB2_9BRAS|nr:unnamed protein product [Arabis nemorensis]
MAKKMSSPLKFSPTKFLPPALPRSMVVRWVSLPPPEPPPPLESLSNLLETDQTSVGYPNETLPGLLGLGNLRPSLPVSIDSGESSTCVVLNFGQTTHSPVTPSDLQQMLRHSQNLDPSLDDSTRLFTDAGGWSLSKASGGCSSTSPSWVADQPTRQLLLSHPSPRKPYSPLNFDQIWAWPKISFGPPIPKRPNPSSPMFLQRGVGCSDRLTLPPDRGYPPPPPSSPSIGLLHTIESQPRR